ncbi:response regulator [Pseudoduganella sp. FT25W]|jgi:DNA-binding NtrC family response regulator|uniref:Response regulator n=1 Tax=Duganella alba TaxID=2666081 RepID=A0A6L5QJS3_9BURK|nr:response regulator [Duganella alba]MRX09758.1 response regulator [Duganella alba]MRX17395.1 response regulator [Duganella alba]
MTNDHPSSTYRPFTEESGGAIGFSIFASAPRVLHVDSDHDAALVLAALLVPETQVTHVPTLAAAQELLHREKFALVVLDPDLPDGDGVDLLAELRAYQADARVLMYSARHPEHHNAGSAFLPKPWTSPRQLWRTVSDLLGIGSAMPVEPQ